MKDKHGGIEPPNRGITMSTLGLRRIQNGWNGMLW